MKFSVGYQFRRDSRWIDCIIANKQHIHEVYFSIVGVPNGRTGIPLPDGKFPVSELREKQFRDLSLLNENGFQLNILYNASCYGKDGQSSVFFDAVTEQLEFHRKNFNVQSVTTTSPFIADVVKRNFPSIRTRASINMGIASVQAMDYIADSFDGYYLKKEWNRNIPQIMKFKNWCDKNGKQLFMIANSGCLNDCSILFFHNNLAAHSHELVSVDKRYPIRGCRDYLANPEKTFSLIRDSNWVRPEDLHLYEGLFTSVKLATRINKKPEEVLRAYISGHYDGSILDLTEPDHVTVMHGRKLNNRLFPPDFGKRTAFCDHNCENCNYCKEVFDRVLEE